MIAVRQRVLFAVVVAAVAEGGGGGGYNSGLLYTNPSPRYM